MNKTKALEVFNDVTGLDVDAVLVASTSIQGEREFYVTLTPASVDVDELTKVEKMLRGHDAQIEVPSLRIYDRDHLNELRAEAKKSADAHIAGIERARAEAENPPEPLGGGSELDGGQSVDVDHPTPLPGPQPFDEETRG